MDGSASLRPVNHDHHLPVPLGRLHEYGAVYRVVVSWRLIVQVTDRIVILRGALEDAKTVGVGVEDAFSGVAAFLPGGYGLRTELQAAEVYRELDGLRWLFRELYLHEVRFLLSV